MMQAGLGLKDVAGTPDVWRDDLHLDFDVKIRSLIRTQTGSFIFFT